MFFEHTIQILSAFGCVLILVILANVLQQTLLKNPHEPPVVFHWLPVIGNTVTYGIDPFTFFFDCQAKVRCMRKLGILRKADTPSMATYLPSFCSVER